MMARPACHKPHGSQRFRPDRAGRRAFVLPMVAAFICHLPFAAAGAQSGGAPIGRVPVQPMQALAQEQWVPGRASRDACIDVSGIAGAVVVDPRTLDVVMRGGRRWRVTLAQQCPQLSYYGGFYYKPEESGKFCAGRDRILGRAGGECRVSRIAPLNRVHPPGEKGRRR